MTYHICMNAQRIFSVLSLAVVCSSPIMVSAQTGSANTRFTQRAEQVKARMEERNAAWEEKKDEHQDAFCTRFTERLESRGERMEKRVGNTKEHILNRTSRRTDRRDARNTWLDGKRDTQDERRAALYATLDAKAETDAEKAAVVEFKKTVDAAVGTRRNAIDKAIEDFRTAVDALIASKKTGVSDAYATFKSAVDAAAAKAKSDCEADVDPKTVMSNYQAAVKIARESLKQDRSSIDKMRDDIEALTETRKQAIESAITAFKSTVEAAREKLKSAIGSH